MEKLRYPTKYVSITQYYSNSHKAIDIASGVRYKGKMCDNTEVRMIHDGTIIENAYAIDYGWYVAYKFEMDGHEYIIKDGHFNTKSDLVFGNKYPKGTIINYMGSEGTSDGKHDHHIMIRDDVRVDPTEYEYIYPDQFKGDLETKDLLVYTEEEDTEPEFKVGDRVCVKGYATSASDGTGEHTAKYGGNPDDESDIRYITLINENSIRPYHISVGKTLGDRDRGWVTKDQLTKLN